jgi:quercetin dioxygenase-like cupin family protein
MPAVNIELGPAPTIGGTERDNGSPGGAMQSWEIPNLDVQPHHPQVLDSESEGRAIVIQLPAGERLQEHQVHERAWLLVISGAIEIEDSGGDSISGGAGLLAGFDPNERREVRATEDTRLLLLLSPWPGVGHPSAAAASASD